MKKLVMVMCFALCASLAFAQTKQGPKMVKAERTVAAKTVSQEPMKASKNYKASIFSTKAGGDILGSWDFAANNDGYTTGTIGANTQIHETDGSTVTMIAHTQTNVHSMWYRLPDTTTATVNALANMTADAGGFPMTMNNWFNIKSVCNQFQTGANGFMLMSMLEQYQTHQVGNFDAYIAFDPIPTTGAPALIFSFTQVYTCFNNDKCYIDYSSDNSTWYQYEINVRGVDCASNDDVIGEKSVMLPSACGNVANLYLRLRWACDNNAGGVYGYVWYLDDVTVTEAEENRVDLLNSAYNAGFYHQVPQGLDVPIVWWASLQNKGTNNQAQVTIALNHLDASCSNLSQVSSISFGPLNSTVQADTAIMGQDYFENSNGWYVLSGAAANAPATKFPTTNAGDNYITTSYQATNINAVNTDTILYMVNELQDSPDGNGQVAVWAQDNGVLTPNAYAVDGFVYNEDQAQWYLSSGIGDDNPSYIKPGYALYNHYVTGSNIPANWVIRGMQLVAATQYSATNASSNIYLQPGAKIKPDIYIDSAQGAFNGYIETGAGIYETTVADYNYFKNDAMDRVTRDDPNYKEYMLPGEYSVINIMFPEQPALLPNQSYRFGYELQEGFFAVAGQSTRYVHHYDGDPDTLLYYVYFDSDTLADGTTNVLKKYGKTYDEGTGENHMAWDPEANDNGRLCVSVNAAAPMIRMLVGPRVTMPTFNVNIQCEGKDGLDLTPLEGTGVFHNNGTGYVYSCGQTVSMIQGSASNKIVAEAEDGYVVYSITMNGTAVYTYGETYDENLIEHTSESGIDDVWFDMSGYTTDCNVVVTFAEAPEDPDPPVQGINEATSNVTLNLFPNPANNNVKLNIAGVSGNVDCTILDMSGRVVYSQNVNAEQGTTINVSNFAKGAYFVRITNNEFTKVEKLIVR